MVCSNSEALAVETARDRAYQMWLLTGRVDD